ncbi:endolytic transglycosylase MltG [Fredinandcohnia quinoae]|uniref:Endolytic murein transglycosylase n=1 Tax=Fredinandcohnia quinoae TaxID=2918902 RepID=A0AAW5ED77_9BACI|nr:endolytic transglycosylase MltG [Fredinandcohnia sp. SECRCQ15]MCH1627401.1 endolytic transglycosylase MltG [Fredinandcohnia sp. SECRCQ15]
MSENESNGTTYKKKLVERRDEARVVRKIVLIAFIITLLLISGLIGGGYLYIKSALEPVDPTNKKEVNVTIPIGSSPTTIAKILEKNKIVKNAKVFRYYTKFKNESGFQAGEYKLNQAMTFDQIIESLKSGVIAKEVVFKITIPEGKQLDQIATIIAEKTGLKSKDIVVKLDDKSYIEELMTLYPNVLTEDILHEDIKHPLEGYLFPATYPFYKKDPTIEEVIEVMLSQTEKIIEKYQAEIGGNELVNSPHKLLTMASLIEEEATAKTDRENISSVFYNRIEKGMPLQTDPTVLYALGEHKDRVLYEHLEVNSPYNTYKIQGLPPGPIANAGEMSISAALHPAETDYLYFLAASNGQVFYSKTLEEHNVNKAKYITNED